MKKVSVVTACLLFGSSLMFAEGTMSNEELMSELKALKAELNELKATVKNTNLEKINTELSSIKRQTGGDHLKFSADYRFSYDNIDYKMADGSHAKNNDLLTNRLWIGAKYAPRDDLSFISKLSYLKAFGDSANHAQSNTNPGYANFDWVTNENALDGTLNVKEAYFIYFGQIGKSLPFTASIGRRPSTEGFPINLRDDDPAASPMSGLINVEFDGASFMFDLSKITSISGMYIKACLGRGLTNAKPRFQMNGTDYSKDDTLNKDVDMYGFIFVPYDDGQYSVQTEFVWAQNLIGFSGADMAAYNGAYMNYMASPTNDNWVSYNRAAQGLQFKSVGGYHGGNIVLAAKGIGDFWSEFLDDTTVFLSYAYSVTDPQYGQTMLGSTDSKFGSSWYGGVQIPCLLYEGARWGFEYNQGSQYWRSMTYGEDTIIGSKIAARGQAYEAYYTFPLIGKILTGQLRYTYIDYDYTGSNAFFGADGTPMKISDLPATMKGQYVDTASDFRFYVRYRY